MNPLARDPIIQATSIPTLAASKSEIDLESLLNKIMNQ